ncbi:MAG: glycosyltransferase [Aminipila sp.]
MLSFLAEKNQFSIVLLGPLFKLPELPIQHENVFYLGKKDYNDLPTYLQHFDLCIIPFSKTKLTSACNPIKMYEYLSAGKPVITTDLEECRVETVKVSKTPDEFYFNLMDCLNHDCPEEAEKRMLFAQKNSWEGRVKYISSVIEQELTKY